MKLFKKLLAVTLVAVLAMSLFTACGDASGVPDSTAEMAHWQNLNNAARKYGLKYENDRYTNEKLKSKLDEIDARCQRETGYKCTVYMISGRDTNGNMQVDYSILYKKDGLGKSSTDRFLNADWIGVACIANKQDSQTYTMMECYQKVDK